MLNSKKIISFALAIILAGVFFSCENSIETIREITREDTLVALRAYNIDFTRSDSGKVHVQLISPLMEKYGGKEPYTEFPEGFQVSFFDSTGQKTSQMSANYGIMYQRSKNMRARNDVIVENYETQEQLFTENLFWNRKAKLIRSGTFVKIVTPDKVIFGDSMRANESFSNREIFNIRGELELDDEESPQTQ